MQERDWQCKDRTKIIKKTKKCRVYKFLGTSNVESAFARQTMLMKKPRRKKETEGGRERPRRTTHLLLWATTDLKLVVRNTAAQKGRSSNAHFLLFRNSRSLGAYEKVRNPGETVKNIQYLRLRQSRESGRNNMEQWWAMIAASMNNVTKMKKVPPSNYTREIVHSLCRLIWEAHKVLLQKRPSILSFKMITSYTWFSQPWLEVRKNELYWVVTKSKHNVQGPKSTPT